MAARDFENLLQVRHNPSLRAPCAMCYIKCSIPVFDGLFPEPHNKVVMELLFTMAHWHGLAKLRMHHDLILDKLDKLTEVLCARLRDFSQKTCIQFDTKELQREYNACIQREAKQADHASSHPETSTEPQNISVTLLHMGDPQQGVGAISTEERGSGERMDVAGNSSTTTGPTWARNQGRQSKTLNINTYKFHSYGDYARTIRMHGTMDSYSTEPVSILEPTMAITCSKLIFL